MTKGLRVLSGTYKRKSIKLPSELSVRPTLVRARKMIFDVLIHHLGRDFTFLDAFAGSGIMGIEALSLGASKVIFFDNNPRVIRNLRSNLESFHSAVYTVIKTNSLSPPHGSPVDVIFIDPPYKKIDIVSDVIKKLKKYGWINDNTLIILEVPRRNVPQLKQTVKLIKEKQVANSIFRFLYVIDDKLNSNTFNSSLTTETETISEHDQKESLE
jgi:16S rRNA (guanine966-N2)-methyltransferase